MVGLQIAQPRPSQRRDNVQPDLLVVIILAGGLDVDAILVYQTSSQSLSGIRCGS